MNCMHAFATSTQMDFPLPEHEWVECSYMHKAGGWSASFSILYMTMQYVQKYTLGTFLTQIIDTIDPIMLQYYSIIATCFSMTWFGKKMQCHILAHS